MKYLIILFLIALVSCSDDNFNGTIEETGNIEAKEVVLSSKFAGEIIKKNFEEGDLITKGDTILILDSEALQIKMRQADAAILMATAKLNLLIEGARKEDLVSAEENVNKANAEFVNAQKDKNRFKELLKENAITQKQFDDIQKRFQFAEANLKSAKAQLKKIKSIAREQEIQLAKAALENAKANKDLLLKNISDTYIIAPLSGRISKMYFETGEFAGLFSNLLKIINIRKVDVNVYVSEKEIGKVKIGRVAEVSVDSFPNKVYKGKVTYISPEAEFTPKNIQTKDERTKLVFKVKIEIPNLNEELKPGIPADVKILVNEKND